METSGSLDALLGRVRHRAQTEADAVVDRAKKVAERDLQRTREEWHARKEEAGARVARAIGASKQAARAQIVIQERRAIMEKQEWAINRVFAAAIERLRLLEAGQEDRKGLLVRLVQEAIDELDVPFVRVRLNEAERRLVSASGLPPKVGDTRVVVDEEVLQAAGGPVVSDRSARLVYDNTFEARLERMQHRLRTMAADILCLRAIEDSK